MKERRLWLSRRMGKYAKFSLQTLKHGINFNVFFLFLLSFNLIFRRGLLPNLAYMGCFMLKKPLVPVTVLECINNIYSFPVGAIFGSHLLKMKLLISF